MKRKPLSKTKKREILSTWIPIYSMLVPFLVLFTLFTLVPIIGGVALSLTDFNGLNFPNFIKLENFSRLFLRDEIFLIDIKNTLFLALITGPISIVLSFIMAWMIKELHRYVRIVVIILLYLPALAGASFDVVMKLIFAADSYGIINTMLIRLGVITSPINWLGDAKYTMATVLAVTLWSCFGIGFLAFSAGLQGLDKAYYEAAAIDGLKNRMQELYYVTLPQMWPQLMFSAVMSISAAFTTGDISEKMTGNPSVAYSTDTIKLHMVEVGKVRFEMGYAAAISVVLFAMMQITWSLTRRGLRRFDAM